MPFHLAQRRSNTAKNFPDATIIDVTSRGPEPWVRLSPFYPHGGIPVPGRPDLESASVEGVWQALKVFATQDEDFTKLRVTSMRGLKRTVRRFGTPLGHRLDGELLDYLEARRRIYLPTYRWTLEHRTADLLDALREAGADRDVVLLDYTTNGDVTDLRTPLSHAALIVQALERLGLLTKRRVRASDVEHPGVRAQLSSTASDAASPTVPHFALSS